MKLPLIARKQLIKGVWEFSFGLNGRKFDFKPGQYVRAVVPKEGLKTRRFRLYRQIKPCHR